MPTDSTTTTATLSDITSVQAAAQAGYTADVVKELTKKYKVIAKRKAQVAAYNERMTKLFGDFDAAITAAGDNAAKVMEVINSSKFPASAIHFTPRQDD